MIFAFSPAVANALRVLGVKGLICLVALFAPSQSLTVIERLNQWIFQYFSAWFLWVGLLAFLLIVMVMLSPFGKIRIGAIKSRRELSLFSWVSMLFAAGMGVGMLLWGGSETLFHITHPITQAGLENPTLALQQALAFSYLHWTLHPWALYTVSTLAVAFYVFKQKGHMTFDAIMLPPFLQQTSFFPPLGSWVHFTVLLTFLGGIAVSFAIGTLQVEEGIVHLMPNPHTYQHPWWIHFAVVLGCYLCYMWSCLGGLGKGIKYLSQWGMILSLLLLAWVLYKGWAFLHIQTFIESLLYYVQHFFSMSLAQLDFVEPAWPRLWTIKTWAWWLTWSPFMGMFGALVSQGRTLREIAVGMTLIPSLGSFFWFWVMGELAVHFHQKSHFMGRLPDWTDMNAVLYRILEELHSPWIITALTVFLVALFFVNSADSAAYSLASLGDDSLMEEGQAPNPPRKRLQFIWGTSLAVLALAMLLVGGLKFLQELVLVLVFPYLFLYLLMMLRLFWDTIQSFFKRAV